MIVRQMGPMVQQMQVPCRACRGEGRSVKAGDRCTKCSGERVTTEKRTIEVHIDKGMANGEKIKFSEEGDQQPDIKPGDVYIVLQVRSQLLSRHAINRDPSAAKTCVSPFCSALHDIYLSIYL